MSQLPLSPSFLSLGSHPWEAKANANLQTGLDFLEDPGKEDRGVSSGWGLRDWMPGCWQAVRDKLVSVLPKDWPPCPHLGLLCTFLEVMGCKNCMGSYSLACSSTYKTLGVVQRNPTSCLREPKMK